MLPPLDGTVLLPDCIDFNARHNPRSPIYVFASSPSTLTQITYLEHGRAVDRVAHILSKSHKVTPSNVVAVIAVTDVLVYQTVVMGCIRAGLAPFVISPRLPANSIVHLLRKTNCTQILTTSATLATLVHDVRDAYTNVSLNVEEMPTLSEIYPRLGTEKSSDPFQPFFFYKKPPMDSVLMILHSSGSTGLPKAIAITHDVFIKRLSFPDTSELREHEPDIRFAGMALPPFHQLGLSVQVFNLMYTVKSVALYPPNVSATNPWPTVPTTDNVLSHAQMTGSNAMAVVPSFLEVWAHSSDAVKFLASLEFVAFSGGALPPGLGKKLVNAGVRLSAVYGSTEIGGPGYLIPPRDASLEDWEWLRFGESIDKRWVQQGEGLYELQLLTSTKHAYPVENLPDVAGYATSDIWRRHSSKPDLWQFVGRLDDMITLSTGEKVIPMPMENILLEDHRIQGALAFGQQHHQIGMLIEPSGEPKDTELFINEIWLTIDKANKVAPAYARLFRDMIIVSDKSRSFIRSPKGTAIRKPTLSLYQEDIGALYATSGRSDGSLGYPPPKELRSGELLIWLSANVAELTSASHINEIDVQKDLFQQGIDSVAALILRGRIIRMLSAFRKELPQASSLNIVARHPSIRLLAQHLEHITTEDDNVSQLKDTTTNTEAMINLYSQSIPIHGQAKLLPTSRVVVLTGTTGCLGSHILSGLLVDPDVHKVYALNRLSSTSTPQERQKAAFLLHGLNPNLLDSKVTFIDCVNSRKRLGLSDESYREIQQNCSLIIQNGWKLDFNLNLSAFEENILATRELVDIASVATHTVKFVFISSIAAACCDPVALSEASSDELTGYGESKYVAEQVIQKSGLDFLCLRFGQLCGGRYTGAWSPREWFPLVVKSGLKLGRLPDTLGTISWLPADAASSIVLDMLDSMDTGVFAIEHPYPIDGTELMQCLTSTLVELKGLKEENLKVVTLQEWVEAAESTALVAKKQDVEDMPALKILHFMRTFSMNQTRNPDDTPHQTVLTDAPQSLFQVQPIGKEDVRRWVQYWISCKFI